MGSPAKVLAELFQVVFDEGDPSELFAVAAARSLGLEGSQNALAVMARIQELIENSHRLVGLLNATENQRALVFA